MVIADLNTFEYFELSSSGSSRYVNPPAIYRTLSDNELPKGGNFYNGSGGKFSFFESSYTGSKTTISATEESYSLPKALEEIMRTFDLFPAELAQALKVKSRKTIYNWINGEASPRKGAIERIFELLMIARAWEQLAMPSSKELLHIPILEEESLLDLISSDKLDKERILFAGSRAQLFASSNKSIRDPFA
jgi:predicted DNA-binding transcriptional regulator AlpA